MKLIPYLMFQGNCEDVMNTYQKIFNGQIEEINRFDNPAFQVPEEYKNKIMHARMTFGDNTLMFSDGQPNSNIKRGDNISLSIGLSDEAQTRSIFDQLAEGGKVTMPLEKQFWGSLFGQVDDKFGISWMLNCEMK